MQNFLKKNMRWSLAALAIILLALVGGYLIWGLGVIVQSADIALNVGGQSIKGTSGFNLDAAKKLDLHGLGQ